MLTVRPISLKDALVFVAEHHRRLGRPSGHKFCVSVQDEFGTVRGVATVSRPVARALDDDLTAEVTRLCTDGTKNACSMLSAAAWRTAKGMGFERMITYTAVSEPGTSLRAAGWTLETTIKGQSWVSTTRQRTDKHVVEDRYRWVIGTVSCKRSRSPTERMKQGAGLTHAIRTGRSETAILTAIKHFKRSKQRVSKQAIADAVGMSREHISRRYGHPFS